LPRETLDHLPKPSPALSKPTKSPYHQCSSWLERYYIDVPILQSNIQSLEDQVALLTGQKAKLQTTDKKKKNNRLHPVQKRGINHGCCKFQAGIIKHPRRYTGMVLTSFCFVNNLG
jgi:hypothetical protein